MDYNELINIGRKHHAMDGLGLMKASTGSAGGGNAGGGVIPNIPVDKRIIDFLEDKIDILPPPELNDEIIGEVSRLPPDQVIPEEVKPAQADQTNTMHAQTSAENSLLAGNNKIFVGVLALLVVGTLVWGVSDNKPENKSKKSK